MDGETDYWMDGVDDVDGIKPKLMLYDSLRGEKGKTSSTSSTSSSEKPHAPLKEGVRKKY